MLSPSRSSRIFLNEVRAAAYITMSVQWLRAARLRGSVAGRTPGPPFYKIGAAVRYAQDELDTWLSQRRVDHAARRQHAGRSRGAAA
jgi:hypothetical protein